MTHIRSYSLQTFWRKKQAVVQLSADVPDEVLKKAIEDRDYKVTGIK